MKFSVWCIRLAGATALLVYGSMSLAQTTSPITSSANGGDGWVAQVNGLAISRGAFEQVLNDRISLGLKDGPDLRQGVRRDLVIQSVLAQQAEKLALDKMSAVDLRLAAARQQVLAQAWQQQWVNANRPTVAEIEAEYQAVKTRAGDKQYQIRQIVLRDETAAKLVLEQLKAGKAMQELAKAYSIETLGKEDGGLLPWLTPDRLVTPLADAVRQAKVGQRLAEPVRTSNGYHIVELVAERPFVMPPLENVQGQLLQALTQRKLAKAIQEQVDKARIELN